MKDKKIILSIHCGELTCASEPGKFCQFMGSMKFGQIPVCMLFPSEDGSHTVLENSKDNGEGWTLRCRVCLKNTEVKTDALEKRKEKLLKRVAEVKALNRAAGEVFSTDTVFNRGAHEALRIVEEEIEKIMR